MATMTVLDSQSVEQTVEKPLPPGTVADSASRPVAFSTEGKAQLGALTETAPATDTASSGINGRLQRLAQRITSLMALLPASLGSKAAAASLAMTASTEDIARVGIITETAPASDTASSGLNGRLQRIAQRLTTLDGKLDAANALLATINTSLDDIETAAESTVPVGVENSTGEFEPVAASQTAQVLGGTGAVGDYLSHLLVVPETTAPGQVLIIDNATSFTAYVGGTVTSALTPFPIPWGAKSASGAWKITTGANVHVMAFGNFSA